MVYLARSIQGYRPPAQSRERSCSSAQGSTWHCLPSERCPRSGPTTRFRLDARPVSSMIIGKPTCPLYGQKMIIQSRRALLSSGLVGVLALGRRTWARAAAWPQRPVKFIVPFGPGAGADIGARVFADKLQALWGQPVVVENRPGGDSVIAITTFLNANDDHT